MPSDFKNLASTSCLLLLFTMVVSIGCNSADPPPDVADQDTTSLSDSHHQHQQASTAPKTQEPPSRAELLAEIDRQISINEFGKAKQSLNDLLVGNPDDYMVIVRLANIHAAERDFETAIELVRPIPIDDPVAGLPALGLSADWCFEAEKYDEAEKRYREILDVNFSLNVARRKLAYLLNRRGRRHEASRWVKQLCVTGDVQQDELHSLIVQSDAIYDPPGTPASSGTRPYWPIGPEGEARHQFAQKNYADAAKLLLTSVQDNTASPADVALFGRSAVEAQDDEMTALWASRTNEDAAKYPDHWAALGTFYLREADFNKALRAFAEAIRLNQTDFACTRQLFQCLRSLDRAEDAEIWVARYSLMHKTLEHSNAIAANGQDLESIGRLSDSLNQMGRRLEAIMWQSVAAVRTQDRSQLQRLQQEMKVVLDDKASFPKKEDYWCGMDFAVDPLPDFPDGLKQVSPIPGQLQVTAPQKPPAAEFVDVTESTGLDHRFKTAETPPQKRFTMFQGFGGGVAVLDFDLDGHPDLYFTQGSADAPRYVATESDLLYRNIEGSSSQDLILSDVTTLSGVRERDYTLGVTSGDWNQDGLPDIAIGNLGKNRLLINQGDGTFVSQQIDPSGDYQLLTTSMAMADVTGDDLPDLIALNYMKDPDILRLPDVDDAGNVTNTLLPHRFTPAQDTLYTNSSRGSPASSLIGNAARDASTGLGIVVTDLNAQPGNEVFVANDARKNQFWKLNDSGGLVDIGAAMGCAYGSRGSATGAMGVAAADWDRSGTMDLHTTNFIEEPVSMYMNRDGIFRDLNVRFGLDKASFQMLGFGCQALDYSNDGWQDLVATNGHVDDLESRGQAFRQPTQLFANLGNRLEQLQSVDGDYWASPHLGRALATLDYNSDGAMDFVVTDILEKSTLLENRSTSSHENTNWIQLKVIGTLAERDAVGAKVIVKTENEQWTDWVRAGDGYLCKNQPVLHFGIGATTKIDLLTVTWPNGKSQTFAPTRINCRILLVEGQDESYSW